VRLQHKIIVVLTLRWQHPKWGLVYPAEFMVVEKDLIILLAGGYSGLPPDAELGMSNFLPIRR